MSGLVEIVDTTMRDGNQSLWSATGLTTPDLLAIAPTVDRVGFHALDFSSSTHMAVSVRFHREDPWERIRLISAAMPNTPLSLITPGVRFISWVPADEEVMALVFTCLARNGIRRMQIVDPANDPPRLIALARMARTAGIEEVVLGLTYSISPAHTIDYYAERTAALAAVRRDGCAVSEGPGRPPDDRHRARAGSALPARRRRAPGRAAQPLHDRPGAAGLHGRRARRLRRPPHRDRAGVAGHLQPRRLLDGAKPRGRGLLALTRPRGAGGRRGLLQRARARQGPAAGDRSGVRLRLLPPPAARRHGHDDAADARRSCAAPSSSTRRSRRSSACARRWATRSW